MTYGGPHWGIDNYKLFNYLSDFAEIWLEGVYVCQDDTCEITSLSDHPLKSYAQRSNAPYTSIIARGRQIRFGVKILAAWPEIRLRNTLY